MRKPTIDRFAPLVIGTLGLSAVWVVPAWGAPARPHASPNRPCAESQLRHLQAGQRTVIPIHQRMFNHGTIRYSIPISVGCTALEGMLDTGSTGLRVLPAVTAPSDMTATRRVTSYSYGSGVALEGRIARATVGIGGVTGPGPILVARVDSVGCIAKKPRCPAAHVAPQEYRLGGSGAPDQGYEAIVGINLASAGVPNTLFALGIKAWIVVLPEPGDTTPGALILNPDSGDRAGFGIVALSGHTRPHDATPACITDERTQATVCGPTLLDTGAPGIEVRTAARVRRGFRPGDEAKIAFTAVHTGLAPVDFTLADSGSAHVRVNTPTPAKPGPAIFAGTLPYLQYAVLYDAEHGAIGYEPRARAVAAATTSQQRRPETAVQAVAPRSSAGMLVLADHLASCTSYTTTFQHPITGATLSRRVVGVEDGKCVYVEEMPGGEQMECHYSVSERNVVARYYRDVAHAESYGMEDTVHAGAEGIHQKVTYTLDGRTVDNPVADAMTHGSCIVANAPK